MTLYELEVDRIKITVCEETQLPLILRVLSLQPKMHEPAFMRFNSCGYKEIVTIQAAIKELLEVGRFTAYAGSRMFCVDKI